MGFSRQEYWSGVPLPSPLSTQQCVYVSLKHLSYPSSSPYFVHGTFFHLVWWRQRGKGHIPWGKSSQLNVDVAKGRKNMVNVVLGKV